MRVVYVAGWMRSGTTLVTEMLGAAGGALAIGELSGIWGAAARDEICSCGVAVTSCPVWGPAFEAVRRVHGFTPRDYERLRSLTAGVLRTRRAPGLARLPRGDRSAWPEDVRTYVEVTETLLEAVAEAAGASVLVDSSKLPPGFLLLQKMPLERLDLVHIFRDPRAVANSELKTFRKVSADPSKPIPPGNGPLASVALWTVFNCSILWLSRFAPRTWTIKYEDLASDPAWAKRSLGGALDLGWSNSTSALAQGHLAVGNPARFGGEMRPIKVDESWREELPPITARFISIVTTPVRAALNALARRSLG